MIELLQSTAQTVVGRGYLSSDHISTATGLDPAITISKNGGNFANPAAGASVMTEIESTGWYKFALGTGDTDTLGPLIIRGTHATMDNIEVVFQVVAASVAQTGDAYAVVAHTDYGNAKLVRSTTPANTLTVDASHQALALLGATQGAVTFGQVKITADVAYEGALDIVNSHTDGYGLKNFGGTYGQFNEATGLGTRVGLRNSGSIGQENIGAGSDNAGLFNIGISGADGQRNNASSAIGLNNIGTSAGQRNAGADVYLGTGTGLWNEGTTIGEYNVSTDGIGQLNAGDAKNVEGFDPALATEAELAKIPKSDSNVSWNATALAAINAEVDTALNTAIPGSPTADSINQRIAAIDDLTPAVAISATTAASVSTGALAVRTYHSLSQAISSTYAGNLSAATKLWLAVKAEKDDTDAQSVVFIEKTAGLTVLAGAAYTTVAHGSLTVGGLAGAWTVTVALDEVATGLLTPYADGMLWAECKALVAGSTVAVWDGVCDVSRGIVNAVA